jgi:hypothetical protein
MGQKSSKNHKMWIVHFLNPQNVPIHPAVFKRDEAENSSFLDPICLELGFLNGGFE